MAKATIAQVRKLRAIHQSLMPKVMPRARQILAFRVGYYILKCDMGRSEIARKMRLPAAGIDTLLAEVNAYVKSKETQVLKSVKYPLMEFEIAEYALDIWAKELGDDAIPKMKAPPKVKLKHIKF